MNATCKAKSKRSGLKCRRYVCTGFEVCQVHGGKSPVGMASASFKTGRHSKYLPQRLMARYAEAVEDATLIELRDEVALTDARLSEVLAGVDTGESGALWAKLKVAFRRYQDALRDPTKMIQAPLYLDECGELIQQGLSDAYAWAEISTLIEQRRKLVESEAKRLKDLNQNITAEKAMVLISALSGAVKRHVTDPDQLRAVARELAQLVNRDTLP